MRIDHVLHVIVYVNSSFAVLCGWGLAVTASCLDMDKQLQRLFSFKLGAQLNVSQTTNTR